MSKSETEYDFSEADFKRFASVPNPTDIIQFGMYKGLPFNFVLEYDDDYITWFRTRENPSPRAKQLLLYADHYCCSHCVANLRTTETWLRLCAEDGIILAAIPYCIITEDHVIAATEAKKNKLLKLEKRVEVKLEDNLPHWIWDFARKHVAAKTIQRWWLKIFWNPRHPVGQRAFFKRMEDDGVTYSPERDSKRRRTK